MMAKVDKKNKEVVQSKKFIGCGICSKVCPMESLTIVELETATA